MTAIEPVLLVRQILTEFGYDVEQGDAMDKRALSSPGYVWVDEAIGTTPHIDLSYRPNIQITVYSSLGWVEANTLNRKIQSDLRRSRTMVFPLGGIHRVITVIEPYRQDLANQPTGVGRSVSAYDLILSTSEKWS